MLPSTRGDVVLLTKVGALPPSVASSGLPSCRVGGRGPGREGSARAVAKSRNITVWRELTLWVITQIVEAEYRGSGLRGDGNSGRLYRAISGFSEEDDVISQFNPVDAMHT